MVERSFLYILGQSSSSDIDQLSYIPVRVDDLESSKYKMEKSGMS